MSKVLSKGLMKDEADTASNSDVSISFTPWRAALHNWSANVSSPEFELSGPPKERK